MTARPKMSGMAQTMRQLAIQQREGDRAPFDSRFTKNSYTISVSCRVAGCCPECRSNRGDFGWKYPGIFVKWSKANPLIERHGSCSDHLAT